MLMAERGRAESLRWTAEGTQTFLGAMSALPDSVLRRVTALPGWTVKHVLAHVAANADALINLTAWARTGAETPMYASPHQREADIAAGAYRSPADLRRWVTTSASALDRALSSLEPAHWQRQVRTAQGRTVPAEEIPWMRAREVMIHAVDLGGGLRFEDLPTSFLAALVDDIVARRSAAVDGPALTVTATDHSGRWSVAGSAPPQSVTGTLADVAAYLAGRNTGGLPDAPRLPHWL